MATSASSSDPTATLASDEATSESSPSATEAEDDTDATATSGDAAASPTGADAGEDDPTASSDETGDAPATSTESGDATAEEPGIPAVPELADLTTVLDNFTFRMEGVVTTDPAIGPQDVIVDIQQYAPDNYHFKTEIGGAVGFEVWLIGTTAYVGTPETGVQELPNADSSMLAAFSPAIFLQPIQNDAGLRWADEVGQETVSGREATHYRLDAEAYARGFAESGEEITNVTGEGGDIWVDNEFDILLKADLDIAFTASDGTPVETQATWEVTGIGSTPEVTAPR
jgi:hypothetical protein